MVDSGSDVVTARQEILDQLDLELIGTIQSRGVHKYFTFLCVLFSEFMVDSGSDVVTARQEILDQLDLELIGTIQSRGVHSTVEKQLYKAMLCIGKTEIEIEVGNHDNNCMLEMVHDGRELYGCVLGPLISVHNFRARKSTIAGILVAL